MSDGIFRSSIRAFFVTLFGMCGLAVGFIPLLAVFGLLDTIEGDIETKTYYTPIIAPNGEDKRETLSKSSPVILQIDITGVIGTELLNQHTVQRQLTESREGKLKNDRVKALLLHINTPGGTVTDSNAIYSMVKAYKQRYKVPVYAYVDGICASGGMYVACAADKIYSSDVSIVGSIGVLMQPFFNVSELMTKVGVGQQTISAGKGKDDLSPFRPWKPDESDSLRSITDAMYLQFLNIIVSNRPKVNKEKLINDYGANVFTADKAVEIGFIDGTGQTLNDTLKMLAKGIGIEDDYYQVIQMEHKYWFSSLLSSKSPLLTGTIQHEVKPEVFSQSNEFHLLYAPGK